MKIAVFHELPPGGARKAVNEISKRLKKRQRLDLFVVDERFPEEEQNYFSSVNYFKFISMPWKGKNWTARIYKDSFELLKLYLLHRKISKKINSGKYDLVFVHGSKYTETPFLLRFLQIPSVYYCHNPYYRKGYEIIFDNPDLNWIRKVYERLNILIRKFIDGKNIKRATYALSNSKYTQLQVYKTYGIASEVYYLGVNEKLFNYVEKEKDIDILFIGSYHPVDGLQFLKNALKNIKIKLKVKLILFENKWINDDREMSSLYQRSKIFVALAQNEPFGLSALEAMSCGVPVIALDEGGYRETVINNKTGYLIPKNSLQLSKKIERLLSDKSLRQKMGHEGRVEIEKNWSWDLKVKNLKNMFADVISK